jgi:hypothetical protein
LAVDWGALQVPAVATPSALVPAQFQDLQSRLQNQLGSNASFAVFSPAAEICHSGSHAQPFANQHDPLMTPIAKTPQPFLPLVNALFRLTSVPPQGFAAVASCTSPHGGRSLDDLPLTNTAAFDRWWLVIMVSQGDDLVVYRRSYPYSQ